MVQQKNGYRVATRRGRSGETISEMIWLIMADGMGTGMTGPKQLWLAKLSCDSP
jgi:hypothetical protein